MKETAAQRGFFQEFALVKTNFWGGSCERKEGF